MVYRRSKVFGQSQRFLTFGFAFGCWRSMQPKTEGSSQRFKLLKFSTFKCKFLTKILEWSKCMFVQCSKRFETLYYIVSIGAFQSLCLNMPTEYLNTKYQTFGFTFGYDFKGRSFFHLHLQLRLWAKKITFGRPLLGKSYMPQKKALKQKNWLNVQN